MIDQQPKVRHLELKDYQTKPWKNGKGQTQDIIVMPEGADHANFDLRFALSPIVEEARFSSFPEVDRVITVIEGNILELAFDNGTVSLGRFESHRFDSGLDPIGKPVGDPIRVVNVMARRGVWEIAICEIASELTLSSAEGNLLFLYAISGNSSVTVQGKETVLCPSETLIISDAAEVNVVSNGQFLVSHLTRAI